MNKRIEHFKELLQVLPRNNIRNSKVYLEKATEMQEVVQDYKKQLVKEIEKRYDKLIIKEDNEEIKTLEKRLEDIKTRLYLLNDNDSYEKSSLDVSLYDLKKFYKNDLVEVNEDIETILTEFNLIGIVLEKEDFNYGQEVTEYMELFLKERNPESNKLKELFDKLYWKNPSIIENIYLNFRHLYFKNKKVFDKYYDEKVKEFKINEEKILSDYKKYLYLKDSDIKTIQDKIIAGELDIKEYEESKIVRQKESLVVKNDNDDVTNENILKLSYTLEEYKYYLKFKDLIEKVKEIYNDKSNKSLTKSILKNIAKEEKKIKKANRKFLKLKEEKKATIISKSLEALKGYYKEYDEAKFKEKVVNSLNDNSTYLDILKLLNSFKINLLLISKTINEELTDEEFDELEKDLQTFIYNPNNTFVNNITINDTRDIKTIILDKYNLVNIKVTDEQLDDNNLDILISTISKLVTGIYILKSNLKYEDLQVACEMKEILEKEGHSDTE